VLGGTVRFVSHDSTAADGSQHLGIMRVPIGVTLSDGRRAHKRNDDPRESAHELASSLVSRASSLSGVSGQGRGEPDLSRPRAQTSSAANPSAPTWTVCSPVTAETAAIVCERFVSAARGLPRRLIPERPMRGNHRYLSERGPSVGGRRKH
jgi:hypothetical protein